MPAGRPRIELTEKDLANMEMLAGLGLSLKKIAAVVGMDENTLCARKKDSALINGILERGRAKAEARVGKSLYERAVEGDVAAIRWWEMTRAGRTVEQRATVAATLAATQVIVTAKAPDWRSLIGAPTEGDTTDGSKGRAT
jgi:hypothetical protein